MTFNYKKLRGRIREKYGTQASLSEYLEMSRVSLCHRLNNNIEFSQKEILQVCQLLDISKEEIPVIFLLLKFRKENI